MWGCCQINSGAIGDGESSPSQPTILGQRIPLYPFLSAFSFASSRCSMYHSKDFQAVSPENRPGEKRYAKNASQDETYRTSCCSSVPFQPAEGFLRIAAEEDTMKEFPCAPVHELWYPVFPQNQSGRYFPSNPSKTLRFLHSTY